MDIETLQKENEKLRVQKSSLIVFIVILLATFSAIQYETLVIGKNAITQLETTVQGLDKLLQNERKITAQNP